MVRLMTKPSGTKRAAVIFAINYTNTSAALKGCINDGNRTKDHVSHYEHVEMLSDNTATKPTRANMLAKMENLARMSTSEGYTNFVIHYSGHGVSVADRNGDEGDHKDEAWYSIDKQLILDDEIRAILNKFSPWSTVMLIVDACHSGTGCDLPLKYLCSETMVERENDTAPICNVLMFSGCMDDQTSADLTVTRATGSQIERTSAGAMTDSLYTTLDDPNLETQTIFQLRDKMHNYMRTKNLDQRPQISSSRPLAADTKLSDYFDYRADFLV